MQRNSCVKALVMVVILLSAAFLFANAAGDWKGKIILQPGMELEVKVTLTLEDDKWSGDIDIPAQGAKDLPLEEISVEGADVAFKIANVPGTPAFDGELSEDESAISGKFTQSGQTFNFELSRDTEKPSGAKSKPEAETLDEIRALIKKEMKDWHVPGLALAVVKNGKVVLAEGFGVRSMKTQDPVTPDTLFAIGSSTKAFTATVMGTLVDSGKVKWEEPVHRYLPKFELKDEFASERMTPRDLLTHSSGLPRHDLMWYGSPLSRKELFLRLKYLEPNEDFRSHFQYQNLMFMTAGYLEEQIEGKPWEAVVREKILDPLGMKNTNFSVMDMQKALDFALPYEYKEKDTPVKGEGKRKEEKAKQKEEKGEGELKEMAFRNIDAVGPAGSINSSVSQMVRWVMLNMNQGSLDGTTIISKSNIEELHSPQMIVRGGIFSQLFDFPETPYLMYGMGWFIQPYRGYRLLHHGGNIDGFSAMVSFMPDEKLGVVILTNLNGNLMVDSTMYEIYDRLLGLDPVDWNSRFLLKWKQIQEVSKLSGKKEDEVRRKPGTNPSHEMQDFAGEYDHAAYGRVSITLEMGKLKASLNGIASALEHFHYDIFRAAEEPAKGLKFTFLTNLRGDIDRVSIPLEDSVDEIVFQRVPPESMKSPEFLSQFEGEYILMGMTVRIKLQENHLVMSVPGQPDYNLKPYAGTEFDVEGAKGYSVRFTLQDGQATEIVFLQPNGVFSAKKKE